MPRGCNRIYAVCQMYILQLKAYQFGLFHVHFQFKIAIKVMSLAVNNLTYHFFLTCIKPVVS